jgi:DNA-binding protein H-NS
MAYATKAERDKAQKVKNRLANVSADSHSARSGAKASLQETHSIITSEMIDKEAKAVAARQKLDRGRTASRAERIVGTQTGHAVTNNNNHTRTVK